MWGKKIECRSDYGSVTVLNSSSLNPEDVGYMRGQSARCGAAEVLVHSEVRGQSRGHAAPELQNKHSPENVANYSSMSPEQQQQQKVSFKGTSGLNQITSATNHTKMQRK